MYVGMPGTRHDRVGHSHDDYEICELSTGHDAVSISDNSVRKASCNFTAWHIGVQLEGK